MHLDYPSVAELLLGIILKTQFQLEVAFDYLRAQLGQSQDIQKKTPAKAIVEVHSFETTIVLVFVHLV